LFEAVGDRLGQANTLKAIGDVLQFRKDNDQALEKYAQALALFEAVGDRLGQANTRAALARLKVAQGDITAAELELHAVIEIRWEMGDHYSEGADLGNFAIALLNAGHKEKACLYARRAQAAFAALNLPYITAQTEQLIAAACGE
ncbi:MAG: tetratricopeptide repeat protein, partial [Chloroflexi bacterium]|nr:tetratricopeptide repeat protein [Chloroflexota bacterium]